MKEIKLTKPLYNLETSTLAKDLDFLSSEKFTRMIRRRIPFFMDGFRYATYAVKKRWGIDVCFFEAGHEQVKPCYISETMNAKASEVWLKMITEDLNFTNTLVDEVKNIIVFEKEFAKSIPQRELTNAETQKYLMEHLSWWTNFFEVAFLWFCVEDIKEKINIEIQEKWSGSDEELKLFFENVYRAMALPMSSVEQRDILAVSTLTGDSFERALVEHYEKYKHLSLHNPDDEYFDIDYYRGRVKILLNPDEYKKQKGLLDSADLEMSEANNLLKNADIPKDLKRKIEFVRWFMYLRTECIDHLMLVNGAFKLVLDSIAEKLSISIDAVLHMTYEEIMTSLEVRELSLDRTLIMDRVNHGYAYLIAPNESYFVTGKDVDILHKLVIPDEHKKNVNEIKGQSAFKGKVTGIARVILDRRESKNLLAGEILVTTMTSPEFVPAMSISGGIITNEGGILCHAAIMSRELRKPCIIGTKIATDVIKTGQKIILDADTGVITLFD